MMKHRNFQKAWNILFPFLLYYLTFNAAYLILAFLYQATVKSVGRTYGEFMTAYEATVSGVAGGLCSLAGILPLLPMLKKELQARASERELTRKKFVRMRELTTTVIFAAGVSLGLNALLTLTGFAESSQTYQEVAGRQYGVAFGVGLVLYGLVSPLAEEVLFRGVIYNRLRQYYGPFVGIVLSALFFGLFHGNLVQGAYGTIMGIFMACLYEWQGSFFWPVLFHAVANLAVYIAAHLQKVQARLFTPWGCVILLAVSVLCVFFCRKREGKINF